MKAKIVLLLASVTMLFASARAQVATGTPPFGSYSGGPDTVNLGNLNVNWVLPLINKPGRGVPFVIAPTYDSSVWYPVASGSTKTWEPLTNYGWNNMPAGYYGGYLTEETQFGTEQGPNNCGPPPDQFYIQNETLNFIYYDAHGTAHPFPGISWFIIVDNSCPSGYTLPSPPTTSESASDGSGYQITEYSVGTVGLGDAKGFAIVLGNGSTAYQEDINGNYVTCNNASCTDTLGTAAMTVNGGPASPPMKLTVPDVSQPYTINYTTESVRTNFGCPGVGEYGPTSVQLPTSIELPNGTEYKITYESTPGYSGDVTGRIANITLPTDTSGGPTIIYSYSGGSNGIECSDGSTPTLKRTTPDGKWTYARALSGSVWVTKITDPLSNTTNVAFDTQTTSGVTDFYEIGRQINSGASTLLETVLTCYQTTKTGCSPSYSTSGSGILTSSLSGEVVYDQFPDSTGVVSGFIRYFDALGSQTEQDTYDFSSVNGGGSFSSTLLLTHYTGQQTFGGFTDPNTGATIQAFDRLSYDTIVGAGGQAQTYTQYNFDGAATISSGAPQRSSGICPSGSCSLGNVTSVNFWISGGNPASNFSLTGTTYQTATYSYFDSGLVDVAADVNGGTTTYVYNGSGGCGDAFPTSVTSTTGNSGVTSLATSATWNCDGGAPATTVDANSNTTTYSYNNDPFWRPSSIKNDATLAMTNYTYQTSSSDTTSSSMNFNGSSSTSTQVTTYDALGRVIDQQTEQAPGALSSATFDTVSTTYDADGRTSFVSLPCSASLSQSCATGSGNPGTLYSYDALNRIYEAQDAGGGYTQYTYEPSSGDVLVTLGPKTTGENLKERMLHFNGAGRLRYACEIITSTQPGGGNCDQTVTGAPALTTAASGYLTEYDYDPAGRLLTVNENDQQNSSTVQTRSVSYDGLGRKISETIPEWSSGSGSPGTSTYVYDHDSSSRCGGTFTGDLIRINDNMGNIICYTYDQLHRPLSNYLAGGNYLSVTPASYYVYDAATYSGTSMSNAKGNLAEAYTCSSPSTCSTHLTDEYFSTSPVTTGSFTGGVESQMWQITPNSRGSYLTSETYFPNGALGYLTSTLNGSGYGMPASMTYSVDGEGRSYSAQGPVNTLVNDVNYLPGNLISKVDYGNGTVGSTNDYDHFVYNSNTDRMKEADFELYSAGIYEDVQNLTTWNENGTLSELQTSDGTGTVGSRTCNYTADDLNRLASINCGNGFWGQNFTYDPFGNITKDGSGGGTSYTAAYNYATNQVSSGIISPSPTYDQNGNQLTSTPATLSWNALGQPWKVVASATTTATYDALGRMVETGSSGSYQQYVYGADGTEFAVASAGNTQTIKGMVPLPGGGTAVYNTVTQTGLWYIRHKNWLGSSVLGSTWGHTVYSEDTYAPFGEIFANEYVQSGGTPDRSFAGMDQDVVTGPLGTGVYDAYFRKYDPSAGRWLSPDPYGWGAVNPATPQSLNRYAYAMNNPTIATDPSGLCGSWSISESFPGFPVVSDSGNDDSDCWGGGGIFISVGFSGSSGGSSGGGSGGGGGYDVNKIWSRTFACNKSATQVMSAVQNDMGQFADNGGTIFAATFPSQPLVMGGQYVIQPGLNNHAGGQFPTGTLVVTVTSESANGWTFTTDPSQHYFNGTVSFSAINAGNGNITFSVTAQANFVNQIVKYTIGPVIKAGENSTWNNMFNNLQGYCQLPMEN